MNTTRSGSTPIATPLGAGTGTEGAGAKLLHTMSLTERSLEYDLTAATGALRVSPAGPNLPSMTEPVIVYPFRYRGARTGRWVKARYKAERGEIAARYAEREIIGPGEERRPIAGYSNPNRREGA